MSVHDKYITNSVWVKDYWTNFPQGFLTIDSAADLASLAV